MTGLRDHAAPILAAAVAAVLLILAAPRVAGYARLAPFDATLAALSRYPKPGPAEVERAMQSRRAAVGRRDAGQVQAELAALDLALARASAYRGREGLALLDRAVTEARAAVAASPARPFAWTALVHAMIARGGDSPLGPLYRMAVRTAPEDPELVLQRVELGLLARPRLDGEGKAALDEQIRVAARGAPKELAQVTRRHFALGPVRAALSPDPALRTRFDAAWMVR